LQGVTTSAFFFLKISENDEKGTDKSASAKKEDGFGKSDEIGVAMTEGSGDFGEDSASK